MKKPLPNSSLLLKKSPPPEIRPQGRIPGGGRRKTSCFWVANLKQYDTFNAGRKVRNFNLEHYSPEQIKGRALTINDRVTGMLKMAHVEGKGAKELLEDRAPFIRTITSDNGKEFANHEQIAEGPGIDFYFARPYHSWERGANENLNGLVGQYFPKGTNFDTIEKEAVERAENILNDRPRKRFRFLTPNEVFAAAIENEGPVAFIA